MTERDVKYPGCQCLSPYTPWFSSSAHNAYDTPIIIPNYALDKPAIYHLYSYVGSLVYHIERVQSSAEQRAGLWALVTLHLWER